MRKTLPASIIILLSISNASSAAQMSDYSERVRQAETELILISESREYEAEGINKVKQLLPKSEQVELDGQAITVNNSWLHNLLDSAQRAASNQERIAKFDEASARLQALSEHLKKTASMSAGSHAGAREKIREIRSRPEFQQRGDNPITAFIKKYRKMIMDFLQEIYMKVTDALFGGSSGATWVYRGLIIGILILALAYAIRMFKRIKPRPKKSEKKRTVLGEEIEAGTTSNDLAEAALRAAKAGDYRGAVRKLYISLLYELAERNLLELEPNATNREYLEKVSRFQPLVAPMRYLTERFDYFWYGMFPSTAEDFSTFEARYKEAISSVRSLGEQTA